MGKPAAIVVNPSGRRPDSVEPAEWRWVQNNYFYIKKNLQEFLFSHSYQLGKIVLFIFSQDQNQQTR
jgi:hypothetical protein